MKTKKIIHKLLFVGLCGDDPNAAVRDQIGWKKKEIAEELAGHRIVSQTVEDKIVGAIITTRYI